MKQLASFASLGGIENDAFLTLGGIGLLPAAFQPFLHTQNAPKTGFIEKLILRKIIRPKIDETDVTF